MISDTFWRAARVGVAVAIAGLAITAFFLEELFDDNESSRGDWDAALRGGGDT